jgi:anti-sigma-K factor RskA
MSADHEALAELAAVHALGALEGEDLARFRAHLETGCPECSRALGDWRAALVLLAQDLREPPPRRLRSAIMARIAPHPGRPPTRARFWIGLRWAASVAVAAGLLAVIASAFVAVRYEARTGQLAREIATLHERMRQEDLLGRLLRDPATRVVPLAGLEVSPGAQGRIVWHERQGGVLFATNLPPVPRDKAYELWIITEGQPLPAGVFNVDVGGHGRLTVAPLPEGLQADRFAVTLEPSAGVAAPTGPMYLASEASG